MAHHVAVSFEDDLVRIVYASSGRGSITVRKALLLRNEEFDGFLAGERRREFVVVSDFNVCHHDILYLPPAKEKYLRQIVDFEIRKKVPDLKDFSFSFSVLGETMHEGRKCLEVFFYAVNNAELYGIIERFAKYGKTVKSIFPVAGALLRMVNTLHIDKKEPQLCIAEIGLNKMLFLMKDGKIFFMRTANSLEGGVHDVDVHDINMTVNYCRQTLRMTPSSILLIGGVCLRYDAAMDIAVPSASMLLPVGIPGACVFIPDNINISHEDIMPFAAPVSALIPSEASGFPGQKAGDGLNVLPRPYRSLTLQKQALAYGTMVFVFLSLIGLWQLREKMLDISRLKGEAALLRSEISMMDSARRNSDVRYAELMKHMTLINFINNINSAPDAQKALLSLSLLKELHDKAVDLKELNITADAGALKLQLKGNVTAAKYAEMEKHYSALTDEMRGFRGMSVVSDALDIKSGGFVIEVRYIDK